MKRVTGIGGIFFQSTIQSTSTSGTKSTWAFAANRTGKARRLSGENCRRQRARPQGAYRLVNLSSHHEIFWYQQGRFHGELPCRRSRRAPGGIKAGRRRNQSPPRRLRLRPLRLDHHPDGNRIELWEPPKQVIAEVRLAAPFFPMSRIRCRTGYDADAPALPERRPLRRGRAYRPLRTGCARRVSPL